MSNTNTNTTNAFFDLVEYVERVRCVDVAAEMAKSIAFRVDVAIAAECRNLLKALRGVSTEFGIDTMAELTKAAADAAFFSAFPCLEFFPCVCGVSTFESSVVCVS